MPCVLHVSGQDFDVDAFLSQSSLEPYRTHHCGENRRREEGHRDSGLSLDLSDADRLDEESADVESYLSIHFEELQRLQRFPGVTDLCLDFGYFRRAVVAQFDRLPAELIKLAGNLGMSIELSLYPSPSPEAEAD